MRLGCADVVEAALTQHSSAALIVGLDQLRAIRKYHSSPVRMQRCVPVLSPSRVVGKKLVSHPQPSCRFCALMVHLTPVFLAPYWRHYCPEFDKNKGACESQRRHIAHSFTDARAH